MKPNISIYYYLGVIGISALIIIANSLSHKNMTDSIVITAFLLIVIPLIFSSIGKWISKWIENYK